MQRFLDPDVVRLEEPFSVKLHEGIRVGSHPACGCARIHNIAEDFADGLRRPCRTACAPTGVRWSVRHDKEPASARGWCSTGSTSTACSPALPSKFHEQRTA